MAFCPNCGAQVTGAYCPNCGTPVAGAGPAGATANPGFSTPPPPIANAPGLTDNVAGALCYLGWIITGILFLVIAPYNRNRTVRFHAFQSIFTTIAVMILAIVIDIFIGLMVGVTHFYSFWMIASLFHLLVVVLWLYLMYMAYSNKMVKLPVVGDLAQKQA